MYLPRTPGHPLPRRSASTAIVCRRWALPAAKASQHAWTDSDQLRGRSRNQRAVRMQQRHAAAWLQGLICSRRTQTPIHYQATPQHADAVCIALPHHLHCSCARSPRTLAAVSCGTVLKWRLWPSRRCREGSRCAAGCHICSLHPRVSPAQIRRAVHAGSSGRAGSARSRSGGCGGTESAPRHRGGPPGLMMA